MSEEERNPDEVYAAPEPQSVEPGEQPDDDVEDITPEPDPEKHDIEAMVLGDRGTRTRIKVQPNGRLLADLQELAERIDSYPSDKDVPDDLIDEWVKIKAEFDHIDTYIVTGRNTDWLRHIATQLKERGVCGELGVLNGILVPLPGKGEDDADGGGDFRQVSRAVVNAQMAAQMVRVGPLGQEEQVTAADIADLYQRSEPEADKLFRAVRVANTQPAKALMPDFSERVSRLSRRGSE